MAWINHPWMRLGIAAANGMWLTRAIFTALPELPPIPSLLLAVALYAWLTFGTYLLLSGQVKQTAAGNGS